MWSHIGRRSWVSDAVAVQCFRCTANFSLFRRRHHCRLCGRVHCYSCCSSFATIPKQLQQLSQVAADSVRLCSTCYDNCQFVTSHRALLLAFANAPCSLRELRNLQGVCLEWSKALHTLGALLSPIHSFLHLCPFTRIQGFFLRAHHKELRSMLRWRVPMLRAGELCRGFLKCDEILSLYEHRSLPHVRHIVCASWKQLHSTVNVIMLPYWLRFCQKEPYYFVHGILPVAERCKRFAAAAYVLTKDMRLLCTVDSAWKLDILRSMDFVELLCSLESASLNEGRLSLRSQKTPFMLPWAPYTQCLNIDTSTLTVLHSASQPWRVTLDVKNTQNGAAYRCDVLIKRDNLSRDKLAMSVAFWMNRMCGTSITTYDVFCASPGVGVIAMLPQTISLYSLKYVRHRTVLNHLLELHPSKAAMRLRSDFVSSCADAAMFAYCVGAGDRHLQNMLIDGGGNPVHIDFGFLFGEDPKGVQAPIRLTQDTVEALGGTSSESFAKFARRCQSLYVKMRQHVRFWHKLSTMAVHERVPGRIRTHFEERFLLGELDARASVHIASVVDNASTPSMKDSLTDMTRHVAHTLATKMA